MNKKITTILIVLAIFLFNGLTLPFCSNSDKATTTETSASPTATITLNEAPLANVNPTDYDAQLTANYEQSKTAAAEWNKDAELMLVSVKLPSDLSIDGATETYTYGSTSDPYYWWTYSLSESSGKTVRALVNKEDYLGTNVSAIPLSYWRTNYIEAFQIADNYGGKDFRQNNQNVTVSETLSVSQPKGWLWWLVEYKTPLGDSLSVRINPNDQTVVDEYGEIITTGTTYAPEATTTTDFYSANVTSTATPGVTTTTNDTYINSSTTY